MPRLAFRNDRTRVWKKNGKPPRSSRIGITVKEGGFYGLCNKCCRVYRLNDDGQFSMLHKTRDNIPHLYCDGTPEEVGLWLDEGYTNLNNIIDSFSPPLDSTTLMEFPND